MTRRILLFAFLLSLSAARPVWAQPLIASAQQAPPPAELPAAIVAALQPAGAKVVSGPATLEFWWVKGVAVAAAGPGWNNVEQGTLVGALRITGPFREIRGKTIKPGVYTLRFGLQPQNGDHLGISPNREFLLMSPAAMDTDPKSLGFDGVVALSKQSIGTSHPASLSVDPPVATTDMFSAYTSELEHKGLIFEVPQHLNGQPAGMLRFGLILVGRIEH